MRIAISKLERQAWSFKQVGASMVGRGPFTVVVVVVFEGDVCKVVDVDTKIRSFELALDVDVAVENPRTRQSLAQPARFSGTLRSKVRTVTCGYHGTSIIERKDQKDTVVNMRLVPSGRTHMFLSLVI